MDATESLFRDDAYAAACEAEVLAAEAGGVALSRTVFYAAGGGQPGDVGLLRWAGGEAAVVDTVKDAERPGVIRHILAEGATLPPDGASVEAAIDWERRLKLMRMHTALHLLSVVIPLPVTGGSIGAEKSRLDFDMPEAPEDKAALEAALNALIAADHPVLSEWIDEAALDAQPELVKTMAVKPPRGEGRIRLVRIGAGEPPVDLQPCGGTHVKRTGEIGRIALGKIEKKGKQNRRVSIAFA